MTPQDRDRLMSTSHHFVVLRAPSRTIPACSALAPARCCCSSSPVWPPGPWVFGDLN